MTGFSIKLLDGTTAATLSQVLPLLLLTLAVEARRIQLHRAISLARLATFFTAFGIIETILVLSIDGLTEGTHFRLSWESRVERIGGFTLARGLGWKLLGSALSDLAAMGHSERRWAMQGRWVGGRWGVRGRPWARPKWQRHRPRPPRVPPAPPPAELCPRARGGSCSAARGTRASRRCTARAQR